MANGLESGTSDQRPSSWQRTPGWLKVIAAGAATALAGGLAAAWVYKKTLLALQQAENTMSSSEFGISEEDVDDTI